MKAVTFKKNHELYPSGCTVTIDDTWADQLLKAKVVTLAKAEAEQAHQAAPEPSEEENKTED